MKQSSQPIQPYLGIDHLGHFRLYISVYGMKEICANLDKISDRHARGKPFSAAVKKIATSTVPESVAIQALEECTKYFREFYESQKK